MNSIEEIVASLGNPPYDLFLAGDGSGASWDKPAGWSVFGLDRLSGERFALMGGCSRGTVNWAEAEPYLRGLAYDFHHRHKSKLTLPRKVLVVSDSQYTVNVGNGTFRSSANGEVWAGIKYLQEHGYQIQWHWMNRNSGPLFVALDQMSKQGDVMESGVDWIVKDLYSLIPFRNQLPPVGPAVDSDRLGSHELDSQR